MTKKEIEALVEAEVSRRMANLTAQFGRDLSERYATKGDVEQAVITAFKAQQEILAQSLNDFAEKDIDDPDHPFSFLIRILDDIGNLQLRVMEIGMYILADEADVERGPGAMERVMKLARVKILAVKHERERFRKDVARFKMRTKNPDLLSAVQALEDILGSGPEAHTGGSQQPN